MVTPLCGTPPPGENGHVIGIDMTREQLNVATKHEAWQANKFGFAHPNTRFILGDICDLKVSRKERIQKQRMLFDEHW